MARTREARRFIGRAAELARLDDALSAARDGVGRTVIVGGEAGIGKTWLVERFAAAATQGGAHVVSGACLELGGRGVPYAPFVEGLRGLVRSVERARLPAILGPDRLQLARLLPELAERSEDVSDDPEFDRNGQARLFELVLGVIERLSRTAPVVLVIEDLQWADEATRDLLAFLVRNLRASPTVALVSVRTDELGRHPAVLGFLAELERDDDVERLELGAFDRREMAELAATMLGTNSPAALVDELLTRTGGNPFYADQLLASASNGGSGALPPQLRDVLLARIAVLPLRVQEVLRAAAAAGRRVDEDVLAAVLDMPHRAVTDALRTAIDEGIVVDFKAPDGRPADTRSGTRSSARSCIRSCSRASASDCMLPSPRSCRLAARLVACPSSRRSSPISGMQLATRLMPSPPMSRRDGQVNGPSRLPTLLVITSARSSSGTVPARWGSARVLTMCSSSSERPTVPSSPATTLVPSIAPVPVSRS